MRKNKGISLIVLIITIIVIIILATAVLISVINNNPIAEANKAKYENDRDNMQAVFTNTVAKIAAENKGVVEVTAGQINTEIKGVSETTGEVSYTVTDATNEANATGTIIFDKNDNTETTYYTGKKLPIYAAGETKWYVDNEGVISLEVAGVKYGSGVVTQGSGSEDTETDTSSAALVQADPTTYYGAAVTNYETGDDTIDAQVDWQIFHSDGNNIYLIATDYIAGSLAPTSKAGNALNYSNYYIWFDSVYTDYNGSEDITDTSLQALNSKYYEYLTANSTTSGENDYNMQSVAYMMDTSEAVWGKFAGVDAAYAIGGPTLELFLDSYNAKKGTTYKYNVDSTIGYKVSKDGGSTWTNSFDGLDTADSQYVISATDKTKGIRLASPSTRGTEILMGVDYDGIVCGDYYYNNWFEYGNFLGLRPLVCLNSDVELEAVEGGFAIVK